MINIFANDGNPFIKFVNQIHCIFLIILECINSYEFIRNNMKLKFIYKMF